ncbi:MAG TPA: hypothetical protein VES61_02485 [Gaiellaceae bacterium]|nr:hypothetical protein [Gaiellaceae bacterium]
MSEIEPNAEGPDPSEQEGDSSLERRREVEAQRGRGHENPDGAASPDSQPDE